MQYLPGTKLEVTDISLGFEYLSPSIALAKGLTLAQVKTVTGLEQSTIQNWIKRGWVAHPENKRYGEYQLARIIIINMLRASMQLDNIAKLLRFVNGDADNREDDIIPDSILYTHLCAIISKCEQKGITDAVSVAGVVSDEMDGYREAYPGAAEKLKQTLTVMTLAYIAAEIQHEMQAYFNDMEL